MILVTGATGLVGSSLLAKLVRTEKTIRALYRTTKKRDYVKHIFSYYFNDVEAYFNLIEWVKADITNIPELEQAFKGVTTVYHCAGLISFNPSDYSKLRQVNIEGTANVVNLCIAFKVEKLCHVSSIAALGEPQKGQATTEETPWNPYANNSTYGITKYGAEIEVWRGTQEGLNTIIINPGVIIGSCFWHSGSGRIFKQVYNGISYFTPGNVAIVTVEDVADCMIRLMQSDIKNESFIVVDQSLSFKSFITEVANGLGKVPPKKQASKLLIAIGWRLDWVRSKLLGKQRMLTKDIANSLFSRQTFENSKLKRAINFNYTDTRAAIQQTAKIFLEEQSANH